MTHTSKHRVWSPKRRLVRNIPETFKGLGLSQQNRTSVTDKDKKVSGYTYTTNNLLETAQDIDGYKIKYAYTTTVAGEPNRIKTIS